MERNDPRTRENSDREYRYYERRSGFGHERKCMDGRITGCGKCVGYCTFSGHPGFLTGTQRSNHQCLEKECHYYVGKPRTEESDRNQNPPVRELLLEEARKMTENMEGIRVLSADPAGQEEYVIRYAAISNCYPIRGIEKELTDRFGFRVSMTQIRCDFDRSAALVFSRTR